MGRGYGRGAARTRDHARRWVGTGLLVVGLASACSSGPDDETEVLGIQVERTASEAVTLTPTAPPTTAPAPTPTRPPASESATPSSPPSPDVGTSTTTPPPAPPPPPPPSPAPRPSPPPSPAPSPSPEPSPTPAGPVRMQSHDGHSYVSWFREEEPDGQGGTRHVWGEVSAAPPVTRDGSEPLRVRLVDVWATEDDSEPRSARCVGTIEVDGDRAVRADGAYTVDLVVDDAVVATDTRRIDVVVEPGTTVAVTDAGDVEVRVPDDAHVGCRVRFVSDQP